MVWLERRSIKLAGLKARMHGMALERIKPLTPEEENERLKIAMAKHAGPAAVAAIEADVYGDQHDTEPFAKLK